MISHFVFHPNHLPCLKCFALGNYANYSSTARPMDQILSSAYFVIKLLLTTIIPIFLCTVCGCLHTTTAELNSWWHTIWLVNSQIFTIWHFTEKVCQSLLEFTNINTIFLKMKMKWKHSSLYTFLATIFKNGWWLSKPETRNQQLSPWNLQVPRLHPWHSSSRAKCSFNRPLLFSLRCSWESKG